MLWYHDHQRGWCCELVQAVAPWGQGGTSARQAPTYSEEACHHPGAGLADDLRPRQRGLGGRRGMAGGEAPGMRQRKARAQPAPGAR